MRDSSTLTNTHERRIDDRFLVPQDGNDALIHHRFTLLKFFFGFRPAEVFPAFDSDRNRANRAPSDSRARSCGTIFLPPRRAERAESKRMRATSAHRRR